MDAADAVRRHSETLPPISHINIEKFKEEPAMTTASVLSSPATATTGSFPSGPPPPYSYASTTTATTAPAVTGLISPPESRRMSGDDRESGSGPVTHPPRQSLPPINEALADSPIAYSLPPPPSHPRHPASSTQNTPTTSYFPPSTPLPRSHPDPVTAPPSERHSPRTEHRRPSGPSRPYGSDYSAARVPRLEMPPVHHHPPPQQHHSPYLYDSAHGRPIYTYPPASGANPHSPTTHAPASASAHPYSPNTTHAPPPAPIAANTHPAATHPPAPTPYSPTTYNSYRFSDAATAAETGRVHEAQLKGYKGVSAERYGVSVKRHLDFFDLEASLHEIVDNATYVHERSHACLSRVRETKRSGSLASSFPDLSEVEDMMRRTDAARDLMKRMHDMIASRQATAHAQAQAQASVTAPTASHAGSPRPEGFHKHVVEYDLEDTSGYHDDGKGMGPEAKKRRGRAAAPGRCHSCNRAETPEWRRGPDGARTLCNACGLHYAKLTRKMGSKGGSSLRPKD